MPGYFEKRRLKRLDKEEGNKPLPEEKLYELVKKSFRALVDLSDYRCTMHSDLIIEEGRLIMEVPYKDIFEQTSKYNKAERTYDQLVESLKIELGKEGFAKDESKSGDLRFYLFGSYIKEIHGDMSSDNIEVYKNRENETLCVMARGISGIPEIF